MPEFIRSLVVVLIFAGLTFAMAKKPVCAMIPCADFKRRRNVWLMLTLLGFLAHSFWLFVFAGALMVTFWSSRESNLIALYFTLLFIIPPVGGQIPGFGVINYLYNIDYLRFLSLVLLLPAFLKVLNSKSSAPLGRLMPDKVLIAFGLLMVALELRETTFTDTLRDGVSFFLDAFLPYYVISRSLKTMDDFRHALIAFMLIGMLFAVIGVFEAGKHWLLYASVPGELGANWGMSGYLGRDGMLRAQASTGHPLALGLLMVVVFGFYLYLQKLIPSNTSRKLGMALLAAGVIAPLSRGPWVGMVALIGVYLATGPNALRNLAISALLGVMALPVLAVLPGGEKVINLLPFIGNVDKFNVDYRAKLLDNALTVISRHPLFGSVDFAMTPEMQEMIQGEGIIDVVNTYLLMALKIGYVGVGLFVLFFFLVVWRIFAAMRLLHDKKTEEHLLGRSLLAALLSVLLIIFTVSPISIIPVIYWSLAGLGVAYSQMIRLTMEARRTPLATGRTQSTALTVKSYRPT